MDAVEQDAAKAQGEVAGRNPAQGMAWMRFPLLAFLVLRTSLLGVSLMAHRLPEGLLFQETLEAPLGQGLRRMPAIDGLCRWDCGWFERIATQGYQHFNDTNFWPLFPLLGRAVSPLTSGNVQLALWLVANLASLLSYIALYRLFWDLSNERAARTSLLLFALYPFAFFQGAAYPESLMILFSALATGLALRRQHLAAGIALGLGILARHLTVVAGAALLVAQLRQRPSLRRFLWHPAFLGLLMPFFVSGLYLLFQYMRFGDPLAFWKARASGWGEAAWWGVVHTFRTHGPDPRHWFFLIFSLVPGVGAVALSTQRRWAELAAFALAMMTLLYLVGAEALGRYSAACWPAFLPLGVWLSRRPQLEALVYGGLGMFQGLFLYLFVHQFPIL